MALSTAQDLIDSALRLLGVVDQEGTPSTNQRNQGLDALNAVIDSFVVDNLVNYRYDDEQITITAASMTWGSGGDINTTRPVKIFAARDSNENPLEVLDLIEFRRRGYGASQAGTAGYLALDATMTNTRATLYAYPYGGTIKVSSLKPWTQYSALSTNLGLPPGYVRYLRHVLALELAPEYQVEAPQVCAAMTVQLRGHLGDVNTKIPTLFNQMAPSGGYDITRG